MSFRSRAVVLAVAAALAGAPDARAGGGARIANDAADAERVGAALRYYRDLAAWHIRSELDARALLRVRPIAGAGLSSTYGVRRDPFRKRSLRRHSGVDLTAARGTPVLAAGPGTVVRARRSGGYGRAVYIDHGDGVQTRYAHLQEIDVEEGTFIPAGTLVGKVGSSGRATGPHLHFELRVNGVAVEPVELFDLLGISQAERDEVHTRDRETPRERRRHRQRRRELRSQRPAS
ncbi:MAG TPA: M23 family metallopeptidase [Kofleriaceae bacterium]|nr:M23 family metallopeptidase [Kofleriaceae bacterium]